MPRVILETERLILREMQKSDLAFIAAQIGHPEVMHYWPRPYTRKEAADWIAKQRGRYKTDGYGYWLASLKSTGEPIGQIGVMTGVVEGVEMSGHLGWIIHRPYWRQGYAEEGARGCIRWAFEHLGLEGVGCLVRPENEPSWRLAEKLGYVRTGEVIYADYRHYTYWLARPIEERRDADHDRSMV